MNICCPKCDVDISESYEPADHSVGIMGGGWYCDTCDLAVSEEDYHEPMDGDIGPISFIDPDRKPGDPIGTPLSEISTQPGTSGYAEWVRISKSWGHD